VFPLSTAAAKYLVAASGLAKWTEAFAAGEAPAAARVAVKAAARTM
jgi:hypothetical protein